MSPSQFGSWLPVAAIRQTQAQRLTMRLQKRFVVEKRKKATTRRPSKMERALRYAEMEKRGMSRADIARAEGVSRARVTQVLRLLSVGG